MASNCLVPRCRMVRSVGVAWLAALLSVRTVLKLPLGVARFRVLSMSCGNPKGEVAESIITGMLLCPPRVVIRKVIVARAL